ncbi:MAG: energy-coupling factor ABC transporter substrate-binding protein [Oscillospiraceae bacterium]
MKKGLLITILLILCAVIAIFPLMAIKDSEFGGADGAAEDAIAAVDPDYVPWASSLFELPGGETESLLFCVQTAIGALILGGGFGYYIGRFKKEKD